MYENRDQNFDDYLKSIEAITWLHKIITKIRIQK